MTVIGQNLDVIQDPHMVVYVNNKKYISVSQLVTFSLVISTTRGVPCQHGFMCGCKQWSNDLN